MDGPPATLRAGSTDRRNLASSNFCTLFFSIWETKFEIGKDVLHYNANKRPDGLFFFFFANRDVHFTPFWDFSPTSISTDARKKGGKKKQITWSFVGIVMKNNPLKFRFTIRKTREQRKGFPGREISPLGVPKALCIVLLLGRRLFHQPYTARRKNRVSRTSSGC